MKDSLNNFLELVAPSRNPSEELKFKKLGRASPVKPKPIILTGWNSEGG